ncbi:conserved exported protein of unknown function [Candidatus Nitrospira inopinata]|jgi:hypothetical protein|uniref:Polysaccharide deacetylase n=2 Tax=Candidatus Nitrospira inopinata TaxID=1715989 RepID=A0A0S4KXY6_9BACT|nr:conserved exported protein of unknown function [Candidatus Nitrospira inopinata]
MRNSVKTVILLLTMMVGTTAYFLYPPEPRTVSFPDGKKFAFSIVDDTDMATLERVKPLYDLLYHYGFRTTKTVWVLESNDLSHPPNQGDTLHDPAYRAYMEELKRRGFEIALHGVRGGSSRRSEIIQGLEEFKRVMGDYPVIHVNHSLNQDNVYWGEHRWSFPLFQWGYALAAKHQFFGHDRTSDYFWGDLVKERIRYVNQFTYSDINLLVVNPSMPYRLSDKPFVNLWFPTADGDNLDRFEALLSKENLDRLEREGGVCLVYTHMGAGSFNKDSGADPRFEGRLKDVSSRNGWFVPASEILDYLQEQPGWRADLSFREMVRLEILFFWQAFLRGILPAPAAQGR